jgi:hypothetical protein
VPRKVSTIEELLHDFWGEGGGISRTLLFLRHIRKIEVRRLFRTALHHGYL